MTYPNFNDVEQPAIRAYNRIAVAHNIHTDAGQEKAIKYLEQFNKRDKLQMAAMIQQIKAKGKEAVRKEVFGEPTVH